MARLDLNKVVIDTPTDTGHLGCIELYIRIIFTCKTKTNPLGVCHGF